MRKKKKTESETMSEKWIERKGDKVRRERKESETIRERWIERKGDAMRK